LYNIINNKLLYCSYGRYSGCITLPKSSSRRRL